MVFPGCIGHITKILNNGDGLAVAPFCQGSVIISEPDMNNAAPGDEVVLDIEYDGANWYGAVTEILTRNTAPFLCRYEGSEWHPFYSQGKFAISIADDTSELPEGTVALVQPEEYGDGIINCRISRLCTAPDSPDGDIQIACMVYGFEPAFEQDLLSRHQTYIGEGSQTSHEDEHRIDLDYPFVTIDGPDSKDFDDAVFAEQTKTGWMLWVAIADVTYYIPINSPLDHTALQRSTSVYPPGQCIPMLPDILSTDICSLVPGQPRRVMVCQMHVLRTGEINWYKFFPGTITSVQRLTYQEVDDFLCASPKINALTGLGAVEESVTALHKCSAALGKHRDRRGRIRMPDAQRTRSRALIEECMLSANECAAAYLLLADPPSPALLRRHDEPEKNPIPGISIAEAYTVTLNSKEPHIIIQSLQSLPRAVYTATADPRGSLHFGLQTNFYTHFTSPIRRYPDIIVHRLIKEKLTITYCGLDLPGLTKIAAYCSDRTMKADLAEKLILRRRELREKLSLMADHGVDSLLTQGVVTKVSPRPYSDTFYVTVALNGWEHIHGFIECRQPKTPGEAISLNIETKTMRDELCRLIPRKLQCLNIEI